MYTLGINAVYHDSAACLVRDGEVVAAAEEERFTRIKHGKRPLPFSAWELPYHAIDYCLAAAGIELTDVDHVAYSYDPYLLLERRDATVTLPLEPSAGAAPGLAPWEPLFVSYAVNAERQLLDGAPHRLSARFRSAKRNRHWQWHFVEHHLAHETSAFLPSPFDDAAVLTLDGRFRSFTDTWVAGVDPETGNETPPLGLIEPKRGFGKIWRNNPDVRSALGWGINEEQGATSAVLVFERGLAVYLPQRGETYLLVDEQGSFGGNWRTIPASF